MARIIALGGIFGRSHVISYLDNPLADLPAGERIFNALALLGRSISLCILPHPLRADYSYAELSPIADWWSGVVPCQLFLVAVAGLLAVSLFRRMGRAGFWALWFFAWLSITSNILFPIGTIFAERLLYLPSMAFCLGFAYLLNRFSSFTLKLSVSFAVIAFYSINTSSYLATWKNEGRIVAHALNVSPQSAKVRYWAGLEAQGLKRYSTAEHFYRQALVLYPAYADPNYALGKMLNDAGKAHLADYWLQRALDLDRFHLGALTALGHRALEERKLSQAGTYFARALSVNDYNRAALEGARDVLLALGNTAQAAVYQHRLDMLYAHF